MAPTFEGLLSRHFNLGAIFAPEFYSLIAFAPTGAAFLNLLITTDPVVSSLELKFYQNYVRILW